MTREQELMAWLQRTLGPRIEVQKDTVFMEDLGLAGLDVLMFFEQFAERFDLDMSTFSETNYDPSTLSLVDVWFRGKRVKTFVLYHLLEVIERKAWFDPT